MRLAYVLRHEFGITIEQTKDFFSGRFQKCLTGESDIRRALPHYLEKWDWKLTIDDFLNLWMTSDNRPNHNVLKLVAQLRTNGLPCFVASNQEAVRAAYLRDEMGIQDCLTICVFRATSDREIRPSKFLVLFTNTRASMNRRFFSGTTSRRMCKLHRNSVGMLSCSMALSPSQMSRDIARNFRVEKSSITETNPEGLPVKANLRACFRSQLPHESAVVSERESGA